MSWLTVWVQAVTTLRRVVSSTPEGLAVAAAAHDVGVLGDEDVAGDVGGVQRVALDGGAPGQSASTWDLDDLLTLVKEKARQATTEAASTLDRLAASSGQPRGGECKQVLVAGMAGGHGGVVQQAMPLVVSKARLSA